MYYLPCASAERKPPRRRLHSVPLSRDEFDPEPRTTTETARAAIRESLSKGADRCSIEPLRRMLAPGCPELDFAEALADEGFDVAGDEDSGFTVNARWTGAVSSLRSTLPYGGSPVTDRELSSLARRLSASEDIETRETGRAIVQGLRRESWGRSRRRAQLVGAALGVAFPTADAMRLEIRLGESSAFPLWPTLEAVKKDPNIAPVPLRAAARGASDRALNTQQRRARRAIPTEGSACLLK